MGHYKRKQYKKKSIDLFHQQEMIEDHISNLEYSEEEIFEDEVLSEMETTLMDEPDIVKQLRQEELEGKLPIFLYPSKENEPKTTQITEESNKIENLPIDEPKFNYDDTLKIARKSLQQIEKESEKNILFDE